MDSVDPSRLDLAAEFKASPSGPHSQDLQHLLKLLRWEPATHRYVATQLQSDGPWFLALTGPKRTPVKIYNAISFESETQANWTVFRKRWQQKTGDWLQLGPDDCEDPTTLGSVDSTDAVTRPVLGYASEFHVHSGQPLDFKVSCEKTGHFQASLQRIRSADHEALGPKVTDVEASFNGTYPARRQHIHHGSWLEFDEHDDYASASFAFQAWIWPTLNKSTPQVIASTMDHAQGRGFELAINGGGRLSLTLGSREGLSTFDLGQSLKLRQWYLISASFDAAKGVVALTQCPKLRYALDDTADHLNAKTDISYTPAALLRIAAASDPIQPETPWQSPAAMHHFNGKLETPSLWSRAFTSSESLRIANGEMLGDDANLVARWDFSQDIPTDVITDTSINGRHGRAINLPTRAMKGQLWDGTDYRWIDNPAHYGAIHFHEDDLCDCCWETDFSYVIPDNLKSGLYCARLEQDNSVDWIPFIVSPPVGKSTARLALILPASSYWAYANRHGVVTYEGREHVKGAFANIEPSALFLNDHPELGLSMYDEHRDGSGVCYSSRLRPIVSIRPGEKLWQLPADTHIIDWLDEKGIDYDVISEDDIHEHGVDRIRPYDCVLTGTHPEYPSLQTLDAFDEYQQQGGRFIYFGGNGFYWRVSYHPTMPGVIEMRRAEDGIRAWFAEGGEYYHASTGELGGMWRRMGRAPQSVAGTGMTSQGFDMSTFYERTEQSHDPRAEFIFEGITSDEKIGDFGIIGGGAAGWEIDRADLDLGTPPHALVVARATEFSANYHWMKEELTHTHDAITGETCPLVRCDMVFYETPNGGGVFATSSIAWAGALSHDNYSNNVSKITENVIRRFLDPAPL